MSIIQANIFLALMYLDGNGQQFVLWVLVEKTESWSQRKRLTIDNPGWQTL